MDWISICSVLFSSFNSHLKLKLVGVGETPNIEWQRISALFGLFSVFVHCLSTGQNQIFPTQIPNTEKINAIKGILEVSQFKF